MPIRRPEGAPVPPRRFYLLPTGPGVEEETHDERTLGTIESLSDAVEERDTDGEWRGRYHRRYRV